MINNRSGYFNGGILFCLLGAVCFSTKAVLVKMAYRDTQLDALTLLALRMIFALPFFMASAIRSSSKEDNVPFTLKQWIGIAIVGCMGYYVSSFLDFLGLQFVSAGIERLILFVYPTLVLLISAAVFKERIEKRQWFAVVITYTGLLIAFLQEKDAGFSNSFYLGSFLILTCAFTYAIYIVGSGRLIPKVGAAKFNGYAMTFACIGVLLHFSIARDRSLSNFPIAVYGYSLLMAVLSTVIPTFLVSEGIRRIGASTTAIVSSVGPIATIFLAHFLLGEHITFLQIAGTLLILVGVLLVSWKPA